MPERFTVDHLLHMRRPTGAPFALTADGRLLALSTASLSRGESRLVDDGEFDEWGVPVEQAGGSQVVVVDTHTGAATRPFENARTSWGAQWSPDGQQLAAYVQEPGRMACLGFWDRARGQSRVLHDVQTHPDFAFEVPCWTPDGARVAVKLSPADYVPARRDQSEGIQVHMHEPAGVSEGLTPSWWDWDRGDLALVAVEDGAIDYLARDWSCRTYRFSPDGEALALLRIFPENNQSKDLVILSLADGQKRTLATDIGQSYANAFNWSPDGGHIAYLSDGRLYAVAADGSAAPRDIGGADGQRHRWPVVTVHVAPLWSADGQTVYALSQGELWICAADGGRQRRIDGAAINRRLRLWVQPANGAELVTADGRTLLLSTVEPESGKEGLALLDIDSGALELIDEFQRHCSHSAMWTAADAGYSQCYLVMESPAEPAALWRVDPRQKTCTPFYNPNPALANVRMGASRLLRWTFLDGRESEAALVFPPDHAGDGPLPMVVVHGDFDDPFRFGYDAYDVGNPQLIAARGYAVLYLPFSFGRQDPMKTQPGQFVPLLRRLIDEGVADPARIGAYGISYNAYFAMSMLVQTDLYRTAVCASGLYNLTAQYGRIAYWGWSEFGEDELGGTLWQRRDAHIENSPFFYLDRVDASVLLISGTGDTAVTSQAEDVYRALRRRNKKVTWRSYPGEPHFSCDWSRDNLRDMCNAVLDWFDEHLQGQK